MRRFLVVIADGISEHRPQVLLIQHDNVVEAFTLERRRSATGRRPDLPGWAHQ